MAGATSASSPSVPSRAVLVELSTVQPERLTWLWEGRLPTGKIVLIDGDPSVGKSTLGVELAAHVSTGKPWPDGSPCEQGGVLILSAEDGLADTIRPRLDAAGGDATKVHALTAVSTVDEDGQVGERPATLADIDVITAAIHQTGALLVLIDVMMAFLPGKVDSHKDQDIRSVLSRLTKVGEETGCLFILLRHLNKAAGGSPMYRGGGSIGIVGAARAAYLVARDPDDPETRVLACVKSNLAREPESLSYRLESAPGTDVARVVWTGASAHDAAGLLRSDRDEHDDRKEVDAWLLDLLDQHGGTVNAKDVLKKVHPAGFSVDQAKRAKKRLGIDSVKAGMDGGWNWVLPPEGGTKGAKSAAPFDPLPSPPSALPSPEPHPTDPSRATDASSDARARERGTTGTTGADQGEHEHPVGTTGAVVPVVPTHVHEAPTGTTAPHPAERWRVSGDPMSSPDPDHDTQQRAVALLVAGTREDLPLIMELIEDAVDHGGAPELSDTILSLALVAGQILREGVHDQAALTQFLDQLPARFALEEDGDGE